MEDTPVLDPLVGLKQVCAQLDELIETSALMPDSVGDARRLITAGEAAASKLAAVQVRIFDAVHNSGVWADDGHLNGQTFVAHAAQLKPGTARTRGRLSRALGLLPEVRGRFEAGDIGLDAATRVAIAMSNPRARDALAACDALIAEQAAALQFDTFDGWIRDLMVAADPDGARDRNERTHERRDVALTQEFDGSWHLTGGFGALQGAELAEIWRRFCDAEFTADLDVARSEHGDEFTLDQLDRTDAQRRADAWTAMARAAASAGIGADSSKIVTNIVIDHSTFERELARLLGRPVTERQPGDDDGYTCRTLDGDRLDPTEAVAESLTSYVRRIVIGADSVVIDAGRERRLFTGTARLAAVIGHTTCAWPGCRRPVSRCEIDHAIEWHAGGTTDQHNAVPLCGRHNRHKHRCRTRARCQPDGGWIFHHPDGSEIG